MAGQASKENGKKGGRPPGSFGGHTIEATKAREYLVNRVAKELEPILTAQIEAAKGLSYEDPKLGVVFKKLPDTKAGEYLINQSAGKPKESVELSGSVVTTEQPELDPKMAEEKKKLLEQYHAGLKQVYANSRKNKS